MTSSQISEWEAYDALDPVGRGEWRNELAIANLISVVVNMAKDIYNDPKKGKPEYVTLDDYMFRWGEPPEEQSKSKQQTPEQMAQMLSMIAGVQGITDKIEKK